MRRLSTQDNDFDAKLTALLSFDESMDASVDAVVDEIIQQVAKQGDAAVITYTNRFDRRDVSDFQELVVTEAALDKALGSISLAQKDALIFAAKRIEDYHKHQLQSSWQYEDDAGTGAGAKDYRAG